MTLAFSGTVGVDDVAARIPSDAARYHVYNFKHSHEGDFQEAMSACTIPACHCTGLTCGHCMTSVLLPPSRLTLFTYISPFS